MSLGSRLKIFLFLFVFVSHILTSFSVEIDAVAGNVEIDAVVEDVVKKDSVVRDSKIATQATSDIESQLAAQLAATQLVTAQLEEAQKSIAEIKKDSKKMCWLALGGYVLTVCAVIAGFMRQDKMHKTAINDITGRLAAMNENLEGVSGTLAEVNRQLDNQRRACTRLFALHQDQVQSDEMVKMFGAV